MTETRKITAYTKKNRINESLSNFMPGATLAGKSCWAKQEFIDTINSQPMDPVAICKALNEHEWTTETFKPHRPLDNGFTLLATDPFGNDHIIKIIDLED